MNQNLDHAPLGKSSEYPDQFDSTLLFPVPRQGKRDELDIRGKLPFKGVDIWNAWEVSWLNTRGKPIVAIGEFRIPADSVNIIESKSFKLYLNSLNQARFDSFDAVSARLVKDLSLCAGGPVQVKLVTVESTANFTQIVPAEGVCIDGLDIETDCYHTNPGLLAKASDQVVEEQLVSHLLKSNCPVTGQPDWGSVLIHYKGNQLDHEALLKYIISFRQHTEFHEQCVERIYTDISALIDFEFLNVSARYVRRGGLDINPVRTSDNVEYKNLRLSRQ